jgi:hypothetical protein
MKHNCRSDMILVALIVAFLAISNSRAEQPAPRGALRFANASAAIGKILFTIDGRRWRPDGFGPGESTTFIGVLAGAHRLSATTATAKPIEIPFALQPNTDSTIIAFLRPVFDTQTRQTVQQCELFAQPEPTHEKGKHFYVVYVSARPSTSVTINGQLKVLKAFQVEKVDDLAHGNIKIESSGNSVFEFKAEQNGTFLVVVFDKPDGVLAAMNLPNYG